MNIQVLTGRMYNGTVHGWSDNEGERTCFRGRLNYRLPNGDYAWIDAVCFRDNPNTDANGLVGWLEDNYAAPEDEADGHGGRAIEIAGWLKPTTKQKTVTVNLKGGGKKDIPNVPYDTFEIVIDQASFVPTSHGESGGRNSGVALDDEDFDIEDDAEDEMEIEEEQDEVSSRRNGRGNNGRSQQRSSGNRNNGGSRSSSSSRTDRRSGNSSSSRTDRSGKGGKSGGSKNNGSRNTGRSGGGRKASGDDDFFVE
ncbi:hypothetical protein D3C76_1139470 [compost metagenome]